MGNTLFGETTKTGQEMLGFNRNLLMPGSVPHKINPYKYNPPPQQDFDVGKSSYDSSNPLMPKNQTQFPGSDTWGHQRRSAQAVLMPSGGSSNSIPGSFNEGRNLLGAGVLTSQRPVNPPQTAQGVLIPAGSNASQIPQGWNNGQNMSGAGVLMFQGPAPQYTAAPDMTGGPPAPPDPSKIHGQWLNLKNPYTGIMNHSQAMAKIKDGHRTWTSVGGAHTRVGKFLGMDDKGNVRLQSAVTGDEIPVEFDKLSKEDQQFIMNAAGSRGAFPGARTFTSHDGKFTRQGQFTGMNNQGQVIIKQPNGVNQYINYNLLSDDDKAYINNAYGRQAVAGSQVSPAQAIGAIRGTDQYAPVQGMRNQEVNTRTGQLRSMEEAQLAGIDDANNFMSGSRQRAIAGGYGAPGSSERIANEAAAQQQMTSNYLNSLKQKEAAYNQRWEAGEQARGQQYAAKYAPFIQSIQESNPEVIPSWAASVAAQRGMTIPEVVGEWANSYRPRPGKSDPPFIQAYRNWKADQLHASNQ